MIVKLAVVGAVLLVPGAVALAGDDQGRPVFRQEGRASIYGNEAQGEEDGERETLGPAQTTGGAPHPAAR